MVCCGALFPLTQVQAAGPANKTFGGLAVGKTFTLKVKSRISTATTFTGQKTVPVPVGIPDYKQGEKITFKIGTKGELTAKDGLSLPYKSSAARSVDYYKLGTLSNPQGDSGLILKNSKGKPDTMNLLFGKLVTSGLNLTTYSVNYQLE